MRNRIKIFRKKINSTSGETIAETLVTMIILSLAVLMLAGAVVTSARVNKKADNTDTSFSTESETVTHDNVTITDGSKAGTAAEISISVNFHETENGYKYYEVQ
ncbi:MAG: hypothetical protein PUE78_12990 [Clostridia bacterium]|nr:hypothetical protein [Clostridia bacterium]